MSKKIVFVTFCKSLTTVPSFQALTLTWIRK